jgi:hypothetical protein
LVRLAMIFEISGGISRQFESLTTSPMGIVSAEKARIFRE